MSFADKYFQTTRGVRQVGKLRRPISVPAFTLESGQAWNYRQENGSGQVLYGTDPNTVTTGFTVSGWIKIDSADTTGLNFGYILFANGIPGADASLIVSVEDGKLTVNILTSDPYVITSVQTIQPDVWTHVSVVFYGADVGDENSLLLYINGSLAEKEGDGSAGEATLAPGGADTYFGLETVFTATQGYNLSNVSFWDYPVDTDTIKYYMFQIPSIYTPGLLYWVTFNNNPTGSDPVPRNLVTGNLLTFDTFQLEEGYPHCHWYNGSFIIGEFEINTEDDRPFSLKFPVAKPDDCTNWVACVRWTEPNCDCEFPVTIRRQLWHVCPEECLAPDTGSIKCGEDLEAISGLEDYNGELIPSGAILEIWSVDGQSEALLEEAYELLTSVLEVVTDPTDVTGTALATLSATPNIDIAETWPLTFPLAFDQPLVL